MKESIILEMFYGKRSHSELIKLIPDELKAQVEERKKTLKETLSKEQIRLYLNLLDAIDGLQYEIEETHYTEGFKFGLQMGMEIAKK